MKAKSNRKKFFLSSFAFYLVRLPFFLLFLNQTPIYSVNPIPASLMNPVLAIQEDKGILRLISITPGNGRTGLIYTSTQDKGIPVFRKQNLILFRTSKELSLLNLNNSKSKTIKGSADAYPGNSGFLRDKSTLLFSRKNGDRWETVLYDYDKEKELKSLPGYQPFVSPDQKSILLVGNEVRYSEHGEDSMRVPIHKYSLESGELKTLAWIETDKEKLQITDVYSIADDQILVKVATEKENRLYKLPSLSGELVKLAIPFYAPLPITEQKEQVNISVSSDGKLLTFTERSDGKLGNIVIIDTKTRQRYDSSFVGCFPVIKNGSVYFLGDPEFVKFSKDRDYRPYNNFTLYELDFKKDKIRAITPISGKVELLSE
ncbi:hypothetical protein EHQ53_08310 [Leptospira langatensis]|uniref:WD40 repeat domain-containing protein n=1 Tax=Leptospira langatensis TaxID=2484983 RepID=A0A5F1ZUS4_9LEPT|nr:hypothetical protein [Leptospira langatensis]TGK01364.1 hypothetical protein EHO57_10560 [Leptospira langatensis]TGL42184.1 hypothetical protein EHQ53_08310 [Leptospira langatensis]